MEVVRSGEKRGSSWQRKTGGGGEEREKNPAFMCAEA